jgi:hypothetical protein
MSWPWNFVAQAHSSVELCKTTACCLSKVPALEHPIPDMDFQGGGRTTFAIEVRRSPGRLQQAPSLGGLKV